MTKSHLGILIEKALKNLISYNKITVTNAITPTKEEINIIRENLFILGTSL